MYLKPGNKVRLKPLGEIRYPSNPPINRSMKKNFGNVVTIKDIRYQIVVDSYIFYIEEDKNNGKYWMYNYHWIENTYILPDELFEM